MMRHSRHVCGLFTMLALLAGHAGAQSIRVGPVLQDAEPSSIWVMWETTSGSESTVEYGLTAALGSTASGMAIPSEGTALIHHAQMLGLAPDTVYYYRVRTAHLVSATYSFRTPALASAEKPFRFAALSDTQGSSASSKHYEVINEGIIDFVQAEFGPVLHDELAFVIEPGDLVSSGSAYAQWKDQYFDEAGNLYRTVPIYPVPGNHEEDSHWFFDYFHLPENGTPGFEEHWWYKDHGNLRLIGCDTNSGYRNQEQLDWLDGVLAQAASDASIDFVFAQMHHPHISSIWPAGNTDYTGEIIERLTTFTEQTGKPTIHFFGHTHAYERGQDKEHTHLYVNVAAGEGGIDYWDQTAVDYPEFQRVIPEWGFVLVEVEAGVNPQFRLRRMSRGNDFIARDNEVQDDILIRRYNPVPQTPAPVLPLNGATGVDPDAALLAGSTFSDPDGDTHLESNFQLTRVPGDFANPDVDRWIRFENWYAPEGAVGGASGSHSVNTVTDPDITRLSLDLLEPETTYEWRVRYRDSALGWSAWSASSSFTTGPAEVGACCYLDAACAIKREHVCTAGGGTWLGESSACSECPDVVVVFAESFDAVPLGPSVDETPPGANVWSDEGPAGWDVDRSGMPGGGVTEWRGWSWTDPAWWSSVAGDQGRSGFALGSGVIAVADPDEWDDAAHDAGTFNSWLSTPVIDISGLQPGTARLVFSSSWRPESPQRAIITASYDAGPEVTVAEWLSTTGPLFKPDAVSERVVLELDNPEGASTLELRFGLLDAGNNWWWAIDDVAVAGEPLRPRVTVFFEDFEELALGPSVDEPPANNVWTDTPPWGWLVDDSGVPGVGDPVNGVTEWEGWAFTSRTWWTSVAGDQRRSEFTSGVGTVAVADPDEWDDRGDPEALGTYNAVMQTSAVDIASMRPGTVRVSMDSSWRPENNQRGLLTVSFDGGAAQTLLDWRSQPGANYHPDATNEYVTIDVPNPAGAGSMVLTFSLLDAGNNWWWGFDNLAVTGECAAEFAAPSGALDFFDVQAFLNAYSARDSDADLNADGAFNFFDVQLFLLAFSRGCG